MTAVLERPGSFGQRHFGAGQFGDRRRPRRSAHLADAPLAHPEGPSPRKLHDPAASKALRRRVNPPAGTFWVDVCDRGADTFELLEYERGHGRPFVVRPTRNRVPLPGEPGPRHPPGWPRAAGATGLDGPRGRPPEPHGR
jgi:hypothetical protein